MRAAIFDMDGLLIDSEPLWKRAEQEVFAGIGIRLSDEECEQTLGLRTDMVVAYWHERFPWASPSSESVANAIDARVVELVARQGQAMPGALQALESVQGAGLVIGMATSSPGSLIETVIDALDIGRFIAVACSAMDEAHGKPDPAVYLTTATRLGVLPQECVAFEDTVVGVRSAKAAGMRVIAVPAADHFDDPGFDVADLKLRSLEEFDLDHLKRW
jgi:HAD superfamily hydrolase (TIGR01509 family)